jgi:hypothetical protein
MVPQLIYSRQLGYGCDEIFTDGWKEIPSCAGVVQFPIANALDFPGSSFAPDAGFVLVNDLTNRVELLWACGKHRNVVSTCYHLYLLLSVPR